MDHSELWDEQKKFMDRTGRSRAKEADKNGSLRFADDYRSRSRSKGISWNNVTDDLRARSRNRCDKCEDERREKEQIKLVNGYIGFSFFSFIHLNAGGV